MRLRVFRVIVTAMKRNHKVALRAALTALVIASAACSDKVVPVERFDSPDGVFTADYVKVLYGGQQAVSPTA